MEEKRYAPCPECGGLNGGHSSYKCPKMTLEEAQNKIIEVEQRWIKVNSRMAAGNQKSFSRLKTAIIFYQGKYTLLKVENNKLRQNASKLHQANEVIKVLEYDNNKLKGQVEGLKNAGDEASGYIEFLDVQNNRLRKMLSDICEKAGAGTEIEKMIVEFFKEINTERESAAGREEDIK